MKTVDFYYSIGSRYSYLASTQIEALTRDTSCHVEWHPINSMRLITKREVNPFDGKQVSGQYAWDYRELDANRWANFYGVPYHEPRKRVQFDAELLALACHAANKFGKVEAYSRLLFAEMFHSSLPTSIDDRTCTICAEKCGIAAADFQAVLTDRETTTKLDTTIDRALQIGIFGVPTFVVSGELFWGNDRLVLLRHHLRSQ
jgi:2-hydroxychromene-2-carboxylate isomerase